MATAMDSGGDFAVDEEIDIEGVEQAWISQSEDGWIVTLLEADRHVSVEGRGFERDVVVAAAGAMTGEPVIGEAGLPEGFQEIARGNWVSAIWPDEVTPEAPPAGYTVIYGDGESAITLVESAAPASSVPLLRIEHATEDTEVRGQPALLARRSTDGDVLLQWHEPPGLVVTVASSGAGEREVRRFAEGLRPVDANEVEDLVEGLPAEDLS